MRPLVEGQLGPSPYSRMHRAYVCLGCGYQWARLLGSSGPWEVVYSCYCESCRSPWPQDFPGSLVMPFEGHRADFPWWSYFPLDLQYREWDILSRAVLTSPMLSDDNTPIASPTDGPSMTETAERIAVLRNKVATNTATAEELREGIQLLRAQRTSAAVRRTEGKKREAASKAPVDVSALLGALLGKPAA